MHVMSRTVLFSDIDYNSRPKFSHSKKNHPLKPQMPHEINIFIPINHACMYIHKSAKPTGKQP